MLSSPFPLWRWGRQDQHQKSYEQPAQYLCFFLIGSIFKASIPAISKPKRYSKEVERSAWFYVHIIHIINCACKTATAWFVWDSHAPRPMRSRKDWKRMNTNRTLWRGTSHNFAVPVPPSPTQRNKANIWCILMHFDALQTPQSAFDSSGAQSTSQPVSWDNGHWQSGQCRSNLSADFFHPYAPGSDIFRYQQWRYFTLLEALSTLYTLYYSTILLYSLYYSIIYHSFYDLSLSFKPVFRCLAPRCPPEGSVCAQGSWDIPGHRPIRRTTVQASLAELCNRASTMSLGTGKSWPLLQFFKFRTL